MNRQDVLRDLQSRRITPEQAKRLLAEAAAQPAPAAPSAAAASAARMGASPSPSPNADERIAIVGMSGRYPGADSLDAFWELLSQGRSGVRTVPASRWDVERFYDPRPQQPGKVYCKWLGALDEVESFDPLFFGISPAEATVMDPQHRVFLQEGYRAFEDAGYAPAALDGARCGVYLGIMGNEYVGLCRQAGAGIGEATGNSSSIAAARIAYHLNLKGPAIAVDTACSSSLVATHLACQALLAGEIDLALAGGVTLYLSPETHVSMCAAGMLSASGRCSAFDDSADGFVPGEGVGTLVLKRLSDAIAAGDRIHAVVLGSGINQDGRTNGITAPSAKSQADLLREVYRRHRIDPASISYVEAHGTGTRLGDPIEFEALSTVFGEATADLHFCALGSVKSNIGHASAAAGVAGVHKTLLSLREKRLVPTLHYSRPNPHVELRGSPFVINTELREWRVPEASARRAAVSSFGYSGTNAHLVLEEWNPAEAHAAPQADAREPQLLLLSARGADELRAQAQALARWLQRDAATPLADVAYTLQVGRAAFEQRLAFVAADRAEALARLEDFLAGRAAPASFAGRVTAQMRESHRADGAARAPLRADAQALAGLGERWVGGFDPDWRDLPRSRPGRFAHLPTYAFAKERCWVTTGEGAGESPSESPGESASRSEPAMPPPAAPVAAPVHRVPEALAALELLIGDTEPVEAPVPQALDAHARVAIVGASAQAMAQFARVWPRATALAPPAADAIGAWADALRALGRIDRLVWFAGDGGGERVDELLDYAARSAPVLACFHAIKALLDQGYGDGALEWTLVTRDAGTDPSHAALQGLVASAVKENAQWSLRLVDLGHQDAIGAAAGIGVEQLLAVPADTQGRGWLCYDGQWARERLRPVPVPARTDGAFRRDGVYLIVGGAGGVGEVFSEYLLRHYQARVVWVGRRAADADIEAKRARLAALGPAPLYLQADAADPAALAAVRVQALRAYGRVDCVVHSAIELHDQGLAVMDAARFERAFATKARIAANLLDAFADDAADGVVLFSSLVSYSRDAGQSNYSAGSLYQDALARGLASRYGRRVKTLNWGFWGDIGATAGLPPRVRERFAQAGIGALRPVEAMAALEVFMHAALPQLAALHRLGAQGLRVPAPEPAADAAAEQPRAPPIEREPALAASEPRPDYEPDQTVAAIDLEAHVKHTLLAQLAAILKLAPERIDPDSAFAGYGVDSISSVRIVRALNDALGIELAGTSLFDHSSVNKLVRHVLQDHDTAQLQAAARAALPQPVAAPAASAQPAADTDRRATPAANDASADSDARAQPAAQRSGAAAAPGPIAIVGMSGRFPQSPDLQTLWAHLAAGDEVTEPITRWRIDSLGLPDDIKVCPRGGFLGDIDQFDPLFFNISGTEANFMDPQHRVLLETSWHALEDAGYAGQGIAGARCGVYMGFNGGDYGELLHGQPSLPPHAMWGNAASVLSARIAYYLDLQGPAITLDTACSSSLVAVHLACQGLWTGETDVALAGGVWIQCTPGFLISSSRAGMLSPTGRCRAFGDQADGFVPSEGVGVVVLKRLQDALDAGDHIYGVIRGSAINQDGASNGITAPSAGAQERLQRHVYDSFGIDAGRLQMVEAHGTGTILGDPIEAAALSRSLRHYSDRTGFCAIGSIKTNIGHTGAAAGVAGLIKVLLSLQHRQIPPSLHFDRPNPHIAFADSPLTVNTQLKHWEAPAAGRRLAAVSSFGLSGTNAHVVVEEAPPAAAAASAAQPTLLVLSGFREEDLPAQAAALAEHLERERTLDLAAAGYTLAVGRRHHRHRLALVAHDAADAAAELRRWLAGGSSRVLAGTATAGNGGDERFAPARQRLHALAQARDDDERARLLAELAALHVQGLAPELGSAFASQRRVALPLYRFSRKRHWVPERAQPRVEAAAAPVAAVVAPAAVEPAAVVPATVAPAASAAPATAAPPSAVSPAPKPAAASVAGGVATASPLHPFVHAAIAGADGARYATRWSGQEPFLRDHVVQGAPMLPGAACLEMARAAAELARPGQRARQLRNVVWLRPLAVAEPVDLQVALEPVPARDNELAFRILGAGSDTPHCQGRVVLDVAPGRGSFVDVGTLRMRCDLRTLKGGDYYRVFDLMGLAYGESYRGIERAFVGENQLLAQIRLPAAAVQDGFQLHPSLLDSALQASIGFEIGDGREERPSDGAAPRSLMLFALDQIELYGPCTEQMWVWIRRDPRGNGNKLDIDLCEPTGRVVAALRGVTSREAGAPQRPAAAASASAATRPAQAPSPQPAPSAPAPVAAPASAGAHGEAFPGGDRVGALTLAPAWEPAAPPQAEAWPQEKANVVVIGGDETQFAQLRKRHPRARHLPAAIADTADRAAEELRGAGNIEHLFWLAPPSQARAVDSESIVVDQQRGVMATFRLVKALLKLGYAGKPLGLTVVTAGSQPVADGEPLDPTHAGVHGLIGTLAKEYPDWRVRLVDVQAGQPWPLDALLALPADRDGNAWAHRHGRWHRQRWIQCALPEPEQTAFRRNGVYVVVGGAGGIGEAFSEYLIRRYAAQVVWIGLRKRDEIVEEKIGRLSQLGPAPHYVSADATDQPSLERACADIERRFGTVHGVVHAALLMAGDPLERMDEQRFWRGLAAKIEVSVRMAQAFAHLPLDFVLFFSSIQALEKTPRQANYAAGCTVEDAYAALLAQQWRCPVRVVNWGYWGSVGFAAISSGYRNWIAQAGMGSVEPAEGMAALERLLAGPLRQFAFLKTRREDALTGVQFSDDRLWRVGATAPVVPLDAPVDLDPAGLAGQGLPARFEGLLLELLRHELDALGVFAAATAQAREALIAPQYRAWLRHTLDLLAEHGLAVRRGEAWHAAGPASSPWQEWERNAPQWLDSAELAAPVRLAEATLRELGPVLTGQRAATDVLFPKSSPHLVEGIYRDSPVPDYFNKVLCSAVVRYIERRRRIDPDVRLRILEIGAGTGGTTAPLVRALEPYAACVAEYRFTDISRSFALAAQDEYAQRAPYMSYGSFDVERAAAAQGIDVGGFDIVVAANVLHATGDIARTLRNAKAALKRNGLLVLNEVCATSLFAHVTFGLLKGWWLYEDAHLRIPGSPALSPESWRAVLAEQGFGAIGLPAEGARSLGQQIVLASSDGWIRQPVGAQVVAVQAGEASRAPEPVVAAQARPVAESAPVAPAAPAAEDEEAAIRRIVRDALIATLDVPAHELRDDAPLTDYGLDSMLAVQTVEVLNTTAGTELTTTSLFDHPSIDAVVDHLLSLRPRNASVAASVANEPANAVASRVAPPAAAPVAAPQPQPQAAVQAPAPTAPVAASAGIAQAIAQALVEIAGIDSGDIRGDAEFVDYGIDSMLAVQIVEALNRRLVVELTTTSLFDYPTIDALVAHLLASASHGAGAAVAAQPSQPQPQAPQSWTPPAPQSQPAPQPQAAPQAAFAAPAPQPARSGGLRERVRQELLAVLAIDAADFDPATPFTDYGMDSMLAVQWVERLNQSLRLELTTTAPFDHPTLDALMQHIGEDHAEDAAAADESVAPTPQAAPAKRREQPMSYTI
ncbi:SDR family NAD(P)-dependent oxidoreductase [Lysobacter enzymogenes]|uniref:SDR family NAD(P)-dependent oxidoreductase n=1 Tax=Lysobacter enzymogenes TaxID=69 RepID=UPI0018E9A8BD|nr:SDR family NAD(P)-dependent oxidoreductase [Lysobacter enzymogenes]UZW58492.1 SDR family NAD(P)-dependent oxidoreductase [Lysobacter enzymogenes]